MKSYNNIDEIENKVAPLYGLVLTGGKSTRMKTDKAAIHYYGTSQEKYVYDMLAKKCSKTFLSCNKDQAAAKKEMPVIEDIFFEMGPMAGILSAFQSFPHVAWLAVACDLPFLSEDTIAFLIKNRNATKMATAFVDSTGKYPEPMVAIWEPKSYAALLQAVSEKNSSLSKVLMNDDVELLKMPNEREFTNVNYPVEYQEVIKKLNQHLKTIHSL